MVREGKRKEGRRSIRSESEWEGNGQFVRSDGFSLIFHTKNEHAHVCSRALYILIYLYPVDKED